MPRSSARCYVRQHSAVAVEGFYERGHSAVLAEERSKDRTALRELEDSAIRTAVRRQIDLGLDVVTDGEFRRWMFLDSFYDAVEGFRTDNVVNFRNARGEDVPLRVHEIVERLRPVDSPAAREAAFMTEARPLGHSNEQEPASDSGRSTETWKVLATPRQITPRSSSTSTSSLNTGIRQLPQRL
jgi:methionine synthase II (cobalamin-independent)